MILLSAYNCSIFPYLSYWGIPGAGANWPILFLCSQKTDLGTLFRLYTDAFTIFPTRTVWLGCPNLGAQGSWRWLGILGLNICTHITTAETIRTGKLRQATHIYVHIINHTNHAKDDCRSNLLPRVPSVGHKTGGCNIPGLQLGGIQYKGIQHGGSHYGGI